MESSNQSSPNRRRYSDHDKAKALMALDLNGGNVKYTAQQIDIPRKTLGEWANGNIPEDVATLRHNKTLDLASKFEDLAHLYIAQAVDTVENAKGTNAITGAGIAVDKMRLLRGESTANIAVLDVASLINKTLEIAVKLHRADRNEPLPTRQEIAENYAQLCAKNGVQADETLIDFSVLDSIETQQ